MAKNVNPLNVLPVAGKVLNIQHCREMWNIEIAHEL